MMRFLSWRSFAWLCTGVAAALFANPTLTQLAMADDESESREKDDDHESDKEEEGEFAEKEDGENESEREKDGEHGEDGEGENENESMAEGGGESEDGHDEESSEHHEHDGDSLAGRLTRVKQLIAEGKLDEAQSLLDEAISQAEGMGREEQNEDNGGEPIVLDQTKLQSAIDDLRNRLTDSLKPAREALSVAEEVEKAHESFNTALDGQKVQTKYAAAVKETKAKIREIIAEAKKSPDLAKVFRRGEVGVRLDELFGQLAQIREVDATIEEIERSVAENLTDSSWRSQWEERLEGADAGLAEHLASGIAGDWNDGRLEAVGSLGGFDEIVAQANERLTGVFNPEVAAQVAEAATRGRESIESVFAERDPAGAWEQALSQAAAEQPDNAALRSNEHPARLRTALADLKSRLLSLHDSQAAEASLRMTLGDLTRGLQDKLAGAKTDEAWTAALQEFEGRVQLLREEAEQAREKAEQEAEAKARMEEEQAEAAEAARRLTEEQAEGEEGNENKSEEKDSEEKED